MCVCVGCSGVSSSRRCLHTVVANCPDVTSLHTQPALEDFQTKIELCDFRDLYECKTKNFSKHNTYIDLSYLAVTRPSLAYFVGNQDYNIKN